MTPTASEARRYVTASFPCACRCHGGGTTTPLASAGGGFWRGDV